MAGLPPPGDPVWQELIKNPAIQQLLMQAAQSDNTMAGEQGKVSSGRLREMAERDVSRAPEGAGGVAPSAQERLGFARGYDRHPRGWGRPSTDQMFQELSDRQRMQAMGQVPPVQGEALIALLNNLINP